MNDDKWEAFSLDTDYILVQQMNKFPSSSKSSINNDLNRRWEIFQTAVIKAVKNKIPRSWKSPATRQRVSDDLLKVYKHLSTINRVLQRFSNRKLSQLHLPSHSVWQNNLYDLNRISEQYEGWNLSLPLSLDLTNCHQTKSYIASLRTIVKIKCKQEEMAWSQQQVKLFADLRCDNYTDNLASFIDSSLERCKRKIVLDRVLINSSSNTLMLLTTGNDVKKAVNKHFQTFVPLSTTSPTPLTAMPDRWKSCYIPLDSVSNQIYDSLMSLPPIEEWNALLQSTPKGKAPSPSKISNEMLQHLGTRTSEFLYELICMCIKLVKFQRNGVRQWYT